MAEAELTIPDALADFSADTYDLIRNKEYKQVSNARSSSREFASSSKLDQVDLVHLAKNMDTKEACCTGQNHIAQFDLIYRIFAGQRDSFHPRNIRHVIRVIGAGDIQHILGKLGADRAEIGCRFRIGTEKIFGIKYGICVFESFYAG